MKMFCISDNIDIAVGLRLTGINYEIITHKDKILEKIGEISRNDEYGIVSITESLYEKAKIEIELFKEKNNLPLIVKIPYSSNIKRGINK